MDAGNIGGVHNTQHSQSSNNVAQAGGAKGVHSGQQVQVVDHQSLAANSAEEAGMSTLAQKNSKKMKERKSTDGSAMRQIQLEMIQKLQKSAGSEKGGELAKKLPGMMAQVKAMGNLHKNNLLDLVKDTFGGSSEQFDALEFIEKMLDAEGADPKDLSEVREASLTLMDESGPDIREGHKLGETVQSESFRKDIGDLKEKYTGKAEYFQVVDDLYTQGIMGQKSPKEILKSMNTHFKEGGAKEFIKVSNDYMRVIDAAHREMGRYSDEKLIVTMVNDMCNLTHIKSMLEDSHDLVGKMQKEFGEANSIERLSISDLSRMHSVSKAASAG